ncbi:Uncharacterised protein [Mycolicibacterium fortuitum]|uniref:Uncharacterized protein n=1 Tax=Mycolicibacterium fortuitum TaxID=1766 RepID=A0A378UYV4_MYCFO|nr:Uncharacterised protein [Mycolicibacterium fortuitum]
MLFGSTDASRVAICSLPGGKYEYRGVRLRDGAKLIVPAKRNDDGAFRVENAGIEYLVTSKSLVLSVGEKVIREEAMIDFHRPGPPPPRTRRNPRVLPRRRRPRRPRRRRRCHPHWPPRSVAAARGADPPSSALSARLEGGC